MSLVSAFKALLEEQEDHEAVPMLELLSDELLEGKFHIRYGRKVEYLDAEAAYDLFRTRQKWVQDIDLDHFTHGVRYPSWDEILWEILRLRLENIGEVIEFLLAGANGSAKTFFAAWLTVEAMVQAPSKGPDWQRMFWTLALDEQASETVPQKALYYWLPNDYKTESGAVKTTQRRKLRFNATGGFTDNQFSLDNGAQMQGRFWSKDIRTLEGVRPCFIWSDEGIPVDWLEGASNRLVTAAGKTRGMLGKWEILMRQKTENPSLKFPRELLYQLVIGLHVVTYTFRNGYTDTVQAFDGVAVREIEADPELLPRYDKTGKLLGGELMPKLYHCKEKARRAMWIHAWDNPIGGNWEGLKARALKRPRVDRLWLCYGVAESKSGSPFSAFDERIHVVPNEWFPPGAWAHSADALASGGRAWAMLWGVVVSDYYRCFAPGDLVIVHEYPQTDDVIPGRGPGEVWAVRGGKDGKGKPGPAQEAWPVGLRWRASEVMRIERKLLEEQSKPIPQLPKGVKEWNENHAWPLIAYGYRMMDSRMGNTEIPNEAETNTLIDIMNTLGLEYVKWGRDSGATEGNTRVRAGEQMINDRLSFDRDLAQLDATTGRLTIDPRDGPGPRLWILARCTNLIECIKNYPGIAVGDSAWKDFIDCLRALIISNLEDIPQTNPNAQDNEDDDEYQGYYR